MSIEMFLVYNILLNGYLRFEYYYNSKHIICLYPYSTTRTSVPLSWSLVFIASDGMLMVLYKVISFSLSIKKNAKKTCMILPKILPSIIVNLNIQNKIYFYNKLEKVYKNVSYYYI